MKYTTILIALLCVTSVYAIDDRPVFYFGGDNYYNITGNQSFMLNETTADGLYWRIDGTNDPPTDDWNMSEEDMIFQDNDISFFQFTTNVTGKGITMFSDFQTGSTLDSYLYLRPYHGDTVTWELAAQTPGFAAGAASQITLNFSQVDIRGGVRPYLKWVGGTTNHNLYITKSGGQSDFTPWIIASTSQGTNALLFTSLRNVTFDVDVIMKKTLRLNSTNSIIYVGVNSTEIGEEDVNTSKFHAYDDGEGYIEVEGLRIFNDTTPGTDQYVIEEQGGQNELTVRLETTFDQPIHTGDLKTYMGIADSTELGYNDTWPEFFIRTIDIVSGGIRLASQEDIRLQLGTGGNLSVNNPSDSRVMEVNTGGDVWALGQGNFTKGLFSQDVTVTGVVTGQNLSISGFSRINDDLDVDGEVTASSLDVTKGIDSHGTSQHLTLYKTLGATHHFEPSGSIGTYTQYLPAYTGNLVAAEQAAQISGSYDFTNTLVQYARAIGHYGDADTKCPEFYTDRVDCTIGNVRFWSGTESAADSFDFNPDLNIVDFKVWGVGGTEIPVFYVNGGDERAGIMATPTNPYTLLVGGDTAFQGSIEIDNNIDLENNITYTSAKNFTITPNDFTTNHYYANPYCRNHDCSGIKRHYSPFNVTAIINVPDGNNLTTVQVYGSGTEAVNVYVLSIFDNTTVTNIGSGSVGTAIDVTNTPGSYDNYFSVSVNLDANTDSLYGGYYTIKSFSPIVGEDA